tara:strand:+ start:5576 stop:6169 length:594 start_codon:yes stop_codon:yes gene_type:complete
MLKLYSTLSLFNKFFRKILLYSVCLTFTNTCYAFPVNVPIQGNFINIASKCITQFDLLNDHDHERNIILPMVELDDIGENTDDNYMVKFRLKVRTPGVDTPEKCSVDHIKFQFIGDFVDIGGMSVLKSNNEHYGFTLQHQNDSKRINSTRKYSTDGGSGDRAFFEPVKVRYYKISDDSRSYRGSHIYSPLTILALYI